MLTDAEARFGIVVMTPLAIESGGVSFLAAVVAAPTLARLFADGGCEDNFYLPNLLCQVGPYERKKSAKWKQHLQARGAVIRSSSSKAFPVQREVCVPP